VEYSELVELLWPLFRQFHINYSTHILSLLIIHFVKSLINHLLKSHFYHFNQSIFIQLFPFLIQLFTFLINRYVKCLINHFTIFLIDHFIKLLDDHFTKPLITNLIKYHFNFIILNYLLVYYPPFNQWVMNLYSYSFTIKKI